MGNGFKESEKQSKNLVISRTRSLDNQQGKFLLDIRQRQGMNAAFSVARNKELTVLTFYGRTIGSKIIVASFDLLPLAATRCSPPLYALH